MNNLTSIKASAFWLCIAVLMLTFTAKAQIVIGAPSLGFSQACASESFNSYTTTFVFSPEANLDASNQFIVELSDADGDLIETVRIFDTGTDASSGFVTRDGVTIAAGEWHEFAFGDLGRYQYHFPTNASTERKK